MQKHEFKYFYFFYLLPDNAWVPKDYIKILKSIEKGLTPE